MECGKGIDLCGVLTLESGLGANYYRHNQPSVHGLWPQTGEYGSSDCLIPESKEPPNRIYSCYEDGAAQVGEAHELAFEKHEWEKHGICSGTKDVDDYFGQICSLAEKPVKTMRESGGSFRDFGKMVDKLKAEGYPVYDVDYYNKQIMLSTCFNPRKKLWVIASVKNFGLFCANSTPQPPSSYFVLSNYYNLFKFNW